MENTEFIHVKVLLRGGGTIALITLYNKYKKVVFIKILKAGFERK